VPETRVFGTLEKVHPRKTSLQLGAYFVRVRTYNQKITAAARAIAERKTVGDLS
jgi:hypothetical protein